MTRPRPHSEGKQDQSQSSRTCYVYNKALQTKDYASICFYNDVGETLVKPYHETIVLGDFNAQIRKRTNPVEKATD